MPQDSPPVEAGCKSLKTGLVLPVENNRGKLLKTGHLQPNAKGICSPVAGHESGTDLRDIHDPESSFYERPSITAG
jgi:hypothetical protein